MCRTDARFWGAQKTLDGVADSWLSSIENPDWRGGRPVENEMIGSDSAVVADKNSDTRRQETSLSLADAQEYFASFVPPDVSLADELIAERRKDAKRE